MKEKPCVDVVVVICTTHAGEFVDGVALAKWIVWFAGYSEQFGRNLSALLVGFWYKRNCPNLQACCSTVPTHDPHLWFVAQGPSNSISAVTMEINIRKPSAIWLPLLYEMASSHLGQHSWWGCAASLVNSWQLKRSLNSQFALATNLCVHVTLLTFQLLLWTELSSSWNVSKWLSQADYVDNGDPSLCSAVFSRVIYRGKQFGNMRG